MKNEEEIVEKQFKELKNKIVEKLINTGNTLKQDFSETYSDFIDSDIPNIGITLNNKIIELQHEFEKKGLSFYTSRVRKEGAYYDNMVISSFVGDAIRDGLYDMCINSYNDLSDFTKKMHTVLLTKNTELVTTEKKNPIVSFFSKLWNLLFPHNNNKNNNNNNNNNQKIYSDSINELNSHIEQYKETSKKLENYNLKDNIVDSVVNYIVSKEYDPMNLPGLIEENVIPDFEKLGFANLIPELKDKLIEAYKVLSEKNPLKFYQLPDFNKKDEPSSNSLDELIKIKEQYLSDNKKLFEYSDDNDTR